MDDWTQERVCEFQDLNGLILTRWRGIELALRESGPNGVPQFRDPKVPFLQLLVLYLDFEGERTRQIEAYQDDDQWGLFLGSGSFESFESIEGYRAVSLPTYPTGPVSQVEITPSSLGTIQRVAFSIGGTPTLVVAGETEEHDTGYEFRLSGSEVLLFADPADFEKVNWEPEWPNCPGGGVV